jgi:hypothetical protein
MEPLALSSADAATEAGAIMSAPRLPFSGRPCKRGHQSGRYASGHCIACHVENRRTGEYRRKNRERGNARYLARVCDVTRSDYDPRRAARLVAKRQKG